MTPEGRGITPADAGNRRAARAFAFCLRDHPRGCGEQLTDEIQCKCIAGSPPRMRGTAFTNSFPHILRRITPADAGNRATFLAYKCHDGDHPRGCGEQIVLVFSINPC